jgi:hypothetical protein
MSRIQSITSGWKSLGIALNTIIAGINARSLVQGTNILIQESPTGIKINLNMNAIQSLINVAIANAQL